MDLKNGFAECVVLGFGHNQIQMTRQLIESGSDIDSPTNNSWTSLMSAANEGHVDAAKLLLKQALKVLELHL